MGQIIRVYAVFSKPRRPGNETNFTDIVPNETCNGMCSNNSFPGWRGGKYQDSECMFLSVASRVCYFQGLATGQKKSLLRLRLLCFLLLILHGEICTESPHNVPSSKGRKGPLLCIVWNRDSWKLLQFETTLLSDSWLTWRRGSLKLTMCGEGGQMGWGKLRHWSATHDFPSDSSVGGRGWTARFGRSQSSYLVDVFLMLPFRLHDACIMGKCERLPRGFTVWGGGGRMADMLCVSHKAGGSPHISYKTT